MKFHTHAQQMTDLYYRNGMENANKEAGKIIKKMKKKIDYTDCQITRLLSRIYSYETTIEKLKISSNVEDLAQMNELKGRVFRYQDIIERYKNQLTKYRNKLKYAQDLINDFRNGFKTSFYYKTILPNDPTKSH